MKAQLRRDASASMRHPQVSVSGTATHPVAVDILGGLRLLLTTNQAIRFANNLADAVISAREADR